MYHLTASADWQSYFKVAERTPEKTYEKALRHRKERRHFQALRNTPWEYLSQREAGEEALTDKNTCKKLPLILPAPACPRSKKLVDLSPPHSGSGTSPSQAPQWEAHPSHFHWSCSQAKGRGTATHAEPLPRSFVVTTQPSTIIHEIFSPQSYTRAQRCSHFHSRTDVPMNHQINLGLVFRMYSMIFFDMKQKSYKLGSVCVSHELCHLSAFLMQIKSIYNVKGYFRCIFRAFRRSKVSMTHHSLRDQ